MSIIPRRTIALYQGIVGDIIRIFLKKELIKGQYVEEFEKKFAHYIGTNHALAVSSGTVALMLILETLSLEKGSEVFLPAYTFPSVPLCVKSLGFVPRFIDIDPRTDNIDISELKKNVGTATKVIIATHIFGKPCLLDEIVAFAQEKNIFVIEDCAHALGARYKGRMVGSFGDAAFFSFSLTKPFNTFNGGMIVSNKSDFMNKIKKKIETFPSLSKGPLFKNIFLGFLLRFITIPWVFSVLVFPVLLGLSFFKKDLIGAYNKIFKKQIFYGVQRFKFTNLQAFIGLEFLKRCDTNMSERIEKVKLFNQICTSEGINIPFRYKDPFEGFFPYFYVFKHAKRDMIAQELLMKGIDTGKYLMSNCGVLFEEANAYEHTQKAYRDSLQIPVERCSQKKMKIIAKILKRYPAS